MSVAATSAAPVPRVTVPALWPGSTVVCVGTGPSLTVADLETVRERAKVIAVNDAYKLAPWADVLYACDAQWWDWHQGAPEFAGLKFALTSRASKWRGVQVLRNLGVEGLSDDPTGLYNGRNSGYQAIGLAVLLGATRIRLLGYDMQSTGRKDHYFGKHPNGAKPPYSICLGHFARLVKPLRARNIEVINCTRQTALSAFPRLPIEEAL